MSKQLKLLLRLAPLTLLFSGCTTLALVSPSFTYNNNFGDNNPNEISCFEGNWYSADYCSIPLSRFISITSEYADPFNDNFMFNYQIEHNAFFLDKLNQPATLDKLNLLFIEHYPSITKFAALPQVLQTLYIRIKEDYIPQRKYQELADAYTYLYTISTLHFAVSPCSSESQQSLSSLKSGEEQQEFMLYKAFAMQYANYVLLHISGQVDGKYKNEADLYEHVYQAILQINPNQLQNLGQLLFDRSNEFEQPFESSFYSTGVSFGEVGQFSCTPQGDQWRRFGFEFFGSSVAGVKHLVNFKNRDIFSQIDGHPISLEDESNSHLNLMGTTK